MNGLCERAHATVDKIVEKILDDEPKTDLQKAVDRACFVKNMEINKTGFSPLQLFCGRTPSFPGYSDCTPSSIELEGSNEYLKVLRRLDEARIHARQVDCNQRIKLALKSRINTPLNASYHYGDSIWFKLDSAKKWKAGNVLAQDGKVLFIRYGNFLRRIPVEHVVPAEKHLEDDEIVEEETNDPAPDDVENHERLLDDSFENIEIVVQKEREIESLKKSIEEKDTIIRNLEQKALTGENLNQIDENVDLPNIWKKIKFKLVEEDQILVGK